MAMNEKPKCPLINADGNIFNLLGMASRTLRENGMREQAKEMQSRVTASGSYSEAFIEDNDYIPDEFKDCIMEECDFLKDLITMITVVTFDRFGVIRDYLYERDENDEYFFGIPKGNKIEVYLLTSAEDLYEYLAEESEGFCLIAKKTPRPTEVGGSEVVTVEQKK